MMSLKNFEGNETMSESMSESMSELERTRMQIILHYLDTNKEINSSNCSKIIESGNKDGKSTVIEGSKIGYS